MTNMIRQYIKACILQESDDIHQNVSLTLNKITWLAKKLKFRKGNARDAAVLHTLTISLYHDINSIGLEPKLADEFLFALRVKDYDRIIEYAAEIRENYL